MAIVKCSKCGKPYQISKEQFYKSDVLVFPCLGCKSPITLEKPSDFEDDDSQAQLKKPHKIKRKFFKKQEEEPLSGTPLKKKILRALDNLPPMPKVVSEALEVLADPDSTIDDISKIIETDQSMVSNVLRMVNSAYYSIPSKIASIQQACVLLGIRILKEIIIMAGVSRLLEKNLKGYGFASGGLWKHSVASALCSKFISENESPDRKNDAYIAGLIHDVGKIALDPYVLERMDEFKAFLEDETKDFIEAEKIILGFDHAEIASEICMKWKFPENIAFAILHHHHPSLSQGDKLSYIVHLSDYISKSCGFGFSQNPTDYFEEGVLEFLSLKEEDIRIIKSGLNEAMEQLEF